MGIKREQEAANEMQSMELSHHLEESHEVAG